MKHISRIARHVNWESHVHIFRLCGSQNIKLFSTHHFGRWHGVSRSSELYIETLDGIGNNIPRTMHFYRLMHWGLQLLG
jgi:hypothetical protein